MKPEQPNDQPSELHNDRHPRHPWAHLTAGQIRAYLDGEIRGRTALRCGVHLWRCAACRMRRDAVRARGQDVASMLTLAGMRPASRRRMPFTAPGLGAAAIAVLSAVTVGVTLARRPSAHTRLAGETRVQDICCFDLDGGSRGDDGMLTVSRTGEVVDCVVVYEDHAGTGAFASGDPVRFVSHTETCSVDGLLSAIDPRRRLRRPGT
jgi:hypothetical protein